jgi:hypothetical protein
MELEALERKTGVYGTVNAGDTVTVSDALGQELIDLGGFKKATKTADTATPEQVLARNASGNVAAEPIHADGTNREILNDEGRVIHNSGPEAVVEAEARAEAEVAPDVVLTSEPSTDDVQAKKKK